MPLKRLRKAGDVTHDQPSRAYEDFSTTSGPTSKKVASERRDIAEPTRSSGHSQPCSTSQRRYGRDLCKHPFVNQSFKKAAAAQPIGLQSQQPQQQWSAMQPDTGAQSEDEEDFEEREDDRANDPACIQCDDGGTIMFCDGSCMRAFHCGVERLSHDTTSDDDDEVHEQEAPDSPTKLRAFCCNPLDMPLDLYQHLKDTKDTFHCPNCLAGVHQCFKCKLEGVVETHAADPYNASFANQVVYRCGFAACGRFYHAACIDKTEEDMQAAFLCPLHTCKACGGDDSDSTKGELIPCRRCPKAFHEHCMPRTLLDIPGKDRKQRIWLARFENGECVSEVERSLIYCKAHKIPDDCNNPEHDRPVFRKALLQRWKVHFAHLFPQLMSSWEVLAQVTHTERMPLSDRLKQMSGSLPGSSSKTTIRSGPSSPTTSNLGPTCHLGNNMQPSLGLDKGIPADSRHELSSSKAAQSAGNQAMAKHGQAKHVSPEITGKAAAVPSAVQKAAPQAELTPAELKALARRLKAAKQASQATALDQAVPSALGSSATASGKPRPSSMGPPAARGKRPPLPDRPLLPPKKRRATEASLPPPQGQPAAAAAQVSQGEALACKPTRAISDNQEAVMPPPPLRRLVRAASSSSTDSQQPMARSNQASAPKTTAGASLVQAANPAALNQAADTAGAAPPAAAELLKPQFQSQSQTQSQLGGRISPMQSDLSAQYVGEYQEQPDEEDVDILEESHPVPPTGNTQQPAAGEAGVPVAASEKAAAGTAKAADTGVVEAEAPAPDVAGTPAVAGNATAGNGANPLPSRELQLTTEYARRLQAMSGDEHKAEAKQRVEQIMQACKLAGRVTLKKVADNTRQPEPYRIPSKKTVDEERLKYLERSVAAAERDPSKAGRWLDAKSAAEMLWHEDNLSMVLAPFLHGNRYSSYGRHFTKIPLLRQVAQMLTFYLHDNDTVVDFSCGANAFVPLVKQEGAKQGLNISGRSYDIITSQNLQDFQRCSWMDVRPGDLPAGDRLVIGLNPPFGKNNGLANMFVTQAASFRPRVIVLIVPPAVSTPSGYRVMYEEQETMKDKAFFVPGSKNESWNKVPPALRVLLRRDWVNRNPPDGTGWYHSTIPPIYGSHCRPRQGPVVQPPLPHYPLPQQQMLRQQALPYYPPVQQQQGFQHHGQHPPPLLQPHGQHAQQPPPLLQPSGQHAQQLPLLLQPHSQHAQQAQHAQQQIFGLQAAPWLPLAPGQPQQSQAHHHVQPPLLPQQHSGRPAWLSMPMPASLPGPYHQ